MTDLHTDDWGRVGDARWANTMRVHVRADPLGPSNQIITLICDEKRVKSVLWPIATGDAIRLVRDEFHVPRRWIGPSWQELCGLPTPESYHSGPIQEPGWRVEVNDKTVLAVTDAELRPPYVKPPPPPLWTRMRRVLREQVRADVDWIAGKLGYHRDDACGGDEW